eukprot:TRINITY_DN5794_c0_g2_i1.p1 TRINITY_DN5794_c0_g2~~TRINITY_DN5794_c0_g2_i1.p1  ORF type:complete len:109 (-),score=23.22 TRINITY_DN5794_c0_g2_i1:94-420(-)
MMLSKVINKFAIASLLMWASPLAILYGFNNHLFPGSEKLSPKWHTLLSGLTAVVSVNVIIIVYIVAAFKEPASSLHQPDPTFLAQARESLGRSTSEGTTAQVDINKED